MISSVRLLLLCYLYIESKYCFATCPKIWISNVVGVSRETFNIEVNAKDYGFGQTDTPRTDRSVSLLILSLFSCS